MLGAIVGDIVGSQFEHANHKTKDFELFSQRCKFTDDSVLTLAICQALMDCRGAVDGLSEAASEQLAAFSNKYWKVSYGNKFNLWRIAEVREPYGSSGNGSAMRVSGCAFVGRSLEETLTLADAVTKVTHNHPEGMKGARAVASAIFLAHSGASKKDIKAHLEEHYYELSFTLDDIRPEYSRGFRLNTCERSVPQALVSFLESNSFEDAIRNAVSIGGDSDTLAAIAASIADAYYGIPEDMAQAAAGFLDDDLAAVLASFENTYRQPKIRTTEDS